VLDRPARDEERSGDLALRQPVSNQLQDTTLPRCQTGGVVLLGLMPPQRPAHP
jgi:hypothetical protein